MGTKKSQNPKQTAATFLIAALIFFISEWALAQNQGGGSQVGLMYGLSVPDAENTAPHHYFGAKGGAFVTPALTLGGYYLVSGHEEGSSGQRFDYSTHGIEVDYHITSGSGDTFAGVRAGISKIRTEESGNKVIYSPYHWGVVVGYDRFLASWVALGFEGSYLHVGKSRTETNGSTYNRDSFNMINFMLTLSLRL